jgi:hypothetical protein
MIHSKVINDINVQSHGPFLMLRVPYSFLPDPSSLLSPVPPLVLVASEAGVKCDAAFLPRTAVHG